jgi:hypothetical protein
MLAKGGDAAMATRNPDVLAMKSAKVRLAKSV